MKVLYITNIPSPYRVDFFNELSKSCELTVVYESKRSKERNAQWVGEAEGTYRAVFLTGIRSKTDSAFSRAF